MRNEKTKDLVLIALFVAIIFMMTFTNLGYIPVGFISATIVHIPVILASLYLGPKKGAIVGFAFGLSSFINTFRSATALSFAFSPVIAYGMEGVGVKGIFISTYIAFVPRILVGIVPYYVFIGIKALLKNTGMKDKLDGKLLAINVIVAAVIGYALNGFLGKQFTNLSKVACVLIAVAVALLIFILLFYFTAKKSAIGAAFVYAGLAGAFTNTLLVMSAIFIWYSKPLQSQLSMTQSQVTAWVLSVVSINGVVESIVAAIIVSAVGGVLIHVAKTYDLKIKAESNK